MYDSACFVDDQQKQIHMVVHCQARIRVCKFFWGSMWLTKMVGMCVGVWVRVCMCVCVCGVCALCAMCKRHVEGRWMCQCVRLCMCLQCVKSR